ncbi:MAG: hypothetical protein JWR85_2551 [Marmoricola sp.]|jgi:hypothetical protein|nr:hypothetical protein [Marmoricola sp.]
MIIHLHGYFEGDFLGLLMIGVGDTKVGEVASQLAGWVVDLRVAPTGGSTYEVRNEAGTLLDLDATLDEAGLVAGDIIRVKQAA